MLRWFKKSTKKRARAAKGKSRPPRTSLPRGDGPRLSSAPSKRTSTEKLPQKSGKLAKDRFETAPTRRRSGSGSTGGGSRFRRLLRSRTLWASIISLTLMLMLLAGIGLIVIAHDLPDIDHLKEAKKQHGIRIMSEDGVLVATFGEVYGETIPYDAIPKSLIHAVLATEDRRFFSHGGIDMWGILRAMLVNARAGHVVQGGSTITQQLAKNMFLTPERTMKRKAQEAVLAIYLEGRYRKQEILEIYLNRTYLGAGAYGIDAAARRYFDKSARDLTLNESALLAGLLKAPSRYAPTSNAKRAHLRAQQVLINMEDAGFITEAQAKQAIADLSKPSTSKIVEGSGSRYFADWVVDSLPDYIGDIDDDLVVTTTFSPEMQHKAEDVLTTIMATEGPAKKIKQAALVSMRPDGAVRAMVGGINYATSQYNRAAQARRQAGSTFKLFVYLAALESGYTPQSQVLDAPISLIVGRKSWSPTNFTGDYKGEIPMYMAVRHSINTAAVRISQAVGLYRVASMATRLGITNVTPAPSMALGAVEVSLVEITGAYAHLANNGLGVKPYGITRITTTRGEVLYDRGDITPQATLSDNVVAMMNFMLRGAVQSGTATRAALRGRDVAGKTGTSQDFKDAWFVGFTPQIVTGVWVGNDDNTPMTKVTGGNVPAMIWHNYMQQALAGTPALPITVNEGTASGFFPWQNSPNIPSEVSSDGINDAAVNPLTGGNEFPAVHGAGSAPLPANVPFGRMHPPLGAPQATAPTPAPITSAPIAPPQTAPAEAPPAAAKETAEPEVLDSQFWNTLLEH
jgi:penicillin-binding protein 1A